MNTQKNTPQLPTANKENLNVRASPQTKIAALDEPGPNKSYRKELYDLIQG
jgi:hypothetical protein